MISCLIMACLSLSYAAPMTAVDDAEEQAAKVVEGLGAKVVRAREGGEEDRVVEVWFREGADADLKTVKNFKHLRKLFLMRSRITDEELSELKGLSDLQYLCLDATEVSSEGLKELAGLKNLRGLDLRGTEVTGNGLASLRGLDQLEHLSLGDNPRIDDFGLGSSERAEKPSASRSRQHGDHGRRFEGGKGAERTP